MSAVRFRGRRGVPLLLLLLATGACGGDRSKEDVHLGIIVENSSPVLDLSFRSADSSLLFAVEMNSATEMRGTSLLQTLNYRWQADNWQAAAEHDAWTAQVTFSQIAAGGQQPGAAGPVPSDDFAALEGFSGSYRLDKRGFKLVDPPATPEPRLRQLQFGLAALDFERDLPRLRRGTSVRIPFDPEDIGPFGEAMRDTSYILRYAGDEMFQGYACARLEYDGKIVLAGQVDLQGQRVQISGTIEPQGISFYDRDRGFLLKDMLRYRIRIQQRLVGEDGEAKGSEQPMTQTITLTVTHLDS